MTNTIPGTAQHPKTLSLLVMRVIKFERKRVFEAWVDPDLLGRWFAPGVMKVASVTCDARVGGSYRIAMSGDNGNGKCVNAAVTGIYTEIVPNERLRFTWGWPDAPGPETLVTVEFKDHPEGTELTIRHELFETQEALDRHEHGWLGCLDNLEKLNHPSGDHSFTRRTAIHASRQRVFDALATAEGIAGWWTTRVKRTEGVDNELRLEFEGLDEHILLKREEATSPSTVVWSCREHTDLPEWAGTTMHFHILEHTSDTCELDFRHSGLIPHLDCYDHCEVGWRRFLDSLTAFAETGHGQPFGA